MAAQEHAARRRGRPKGSGSYAAVDAPLIERMRQLMAEGKAFSPTDAARQIWGEAVGHGDWTSKIKRLVRRLRA